MNSRDILALTVKAGSDKKAEDIVVLNMQGISLIADYFMICHANNEKNVQAIAREMKEKAEENGIPVKRLEGFDEAKWVLIDLGDVVAHVFHRDERSYYNLEKLWGDAPREEVSEWLA
ncbi:MAG: ribosome silencing factor [Bacillaceae bacterium]|jgi:ribosome-associated protein|uniref:Ribosomal silencing factor RsfS n=2 Tax=Aeribacillus TaxID=1055323 RepID=A0A165XPA1_9BACI|nr:MULTISPECIES: ribosome silencing factor [Aeribacillus]AXI40169.1 ribosome silencing factor [Bacillaceae bacterium ZC4]REJ21426.1 MAG: ribosome silencing factor [Bacillaceae bacterium]ASS91987.1 ribosome silencing factor [Aeribacillus pallidus]KZM54210.1 ribosome silencing factor RsfS [Aeribacillus pallidus]KZN96251.1 ribosome silencing factor RsfS [Aeribacillus pallidus]